MSVSRHHKVLIVIVGPTASGKTALAIELAERLGVEIVSADSRQFFREMNIGTAKPSAAELARVPHHFINSHSITQEYDAASYGRDALERIHLLFQRRDYVILCGGSGLYIRAVLEGFDDIPEIDPRIRESLTASYREHGLAWLQEQLAEHDPVHYEKVDQRNPHRLIRALEVKLGTGFPLSHFQQQATPRDLPFCVVKVGLDLPREELYTRIDQRMEAMIAQGLFTEAERLYPFRHHNALQTVGYREIFAWMENEYDRAEAIRRLKRNSRWYAKRQLTWFRKESDITWFHPGQLSEIIERIINPC